MSLYKLRSSLLGLCIFLSSCAFFCPQPKYFCWYLEHRRYNLPYFWRKVTEEAGVALTIQNSTADVPGFNVRRVNAHSKVLLCDFPRSFQANAGTVPRFGQDRLIQNRSDQLSGNHPAFDGKQPELLNVSLKKAKASCSRSHYVTHYMWRKCKLRLDSHTQIPVVLSNISASFFFPLLTTSRIMATYYHSSI